MIIENILILPYMDNCKNCISDTNCTECNINFIYTYDCCVYRDGLYLNDSNC